MMTTVGSEPAASSDKAGGVSNMGIHEQSGSSASFGPDPVLHSSSTGHMGIIKSGALESLKPADATVNTSFLAGEVSALGIRSQIQAFQQATASLLEKKLEALKGISDPDTLRSLLGQSLREISEIYHI